MVSTTPADFAVPAHSISIHEIITTLDSTSNTLRVICSINLDKFKINFSITLPKPGRTDGTDRASSSSKLTVEVAISTLLLSIC